MVNDIKLIALDLDGTLLNQAKEISARNQAAIAAARAKGVAVVLTTGRPLLAIQPFLKTLKMLESTDFSITFNGGLVQRNTGEILSQKSLTYDEVCLIKELTQAAGLPCDVISEGEVYMTASPLPSRYPSLNKLLHFHETTFEALRQDMIFNKVVSCTDGALLDEVLANLPTEILERFEVFKTQEQLLEFMPKGINKAFGLTQLIEISGIKPENVMAMGDEANDLSMIEWAGYGVAMGNAVPAVKAAARIVASQSNEEDAVAAVIEQYLL